MKQKIAAFLVVCMLLQMPGGALTAQGSMNHPAGAKQIVAVSADNEEIEERLNAAGGLQLKIKNLLGTPECKFHIWLEPKGKAAQQMEETEWLDEEFDAGWVKDQEGRINIDAVFEDQEIPAGKYVLHLEGVGPAGFYLPYQQDITIEAGQTLKLLLANDYPERYDFESEKDSSKRKMGILVPGNFRAEENEDKEELSEEDLNGLLSLINGKEAQEELKVYYDLNGDGEVDLRDLEYFVRFYHNKDRRLAKAVTAPLILFEMVQPVDPDNGNSISNKKIQELFSGTRENEEDKGKPLTFYGALDDHAIAVGNPVEIAANFTRPATIEGFVIYPQTGSLSAMQDGEVVFEGEDGTIYTVTVKDGKQVGEPKKDNSRKTTQSTTSSKNSSVSKATSSTAASSSSSRRVSANKTLQKSSAVRAKAYATEQTEPQENKAKANEADEDKAIQAKPVLINLGSQIPVKHITIRITKTMKQSSLVDIARVEFLNDMEDHIPEPDLSIPDRLNGIPGDAKFTVNWRNQPNVTGYEVVVYGKTMKSDDTELEEKFPEQIMNTLTVSSLEGGELVNNEIYKVKVRSLNGEWKSPYSELIEVRTEATKRPEPPEQISITGGSQKLTVKWKKMKSTDSYNLYYREKTGKETEFSALTGITGTSTEITGLKDTTTYELYMTGQNQIGVSDPSERYEGKTIVVVPPVTPNFKLLNVPKKGGGASEKIVSVNNHGNSVACDEFATVDGIFETSWIRNDWDAGCVYFDNNKSPIITFDQAYKMDTVVIIPDYEQKFNYSGCKLVYWDEQDKQGIAEGRLTRLLDKDGIPYYEFIAREPFTAKKVRVAVTTGYNRRISFAELKFYEYYSLEDEIFDMYTDTLHIMLRDDVTEDKIKGFYERLEYVDPVSGEKTPRYTFLKQELDNAMDLLHNKGSIGRVLYLDDKLTKRSDGHINFGGGLNTWQPLGVTGLAGDKVILYVGGDGKIEGDSTSLSVIATQYFGESSTVFKSVTGLKVGLNEITIPRITNLSSAEAGGQLYVQYGGTSGAEKYAVRVTIPDAEDGRSKAALIPMINLYNDLDKSTQQERIAAYLEELDNIDPQALHNECHGSIEHAYDPQTCVFGATDIAGKRVMFSLPSEQIKKGLGSGEARAQKLTNTVEAMDQLLTLCYQHKGVSDDETLVNNKKANAGNEMPVSRINIRYQRMFEGAFMYAGGAHIGIGWGSSAGMMAGVPVKTDAKGKYQSGSLFGWGIAHEIGHEINEGAYAVAEVTNNYYAQLAKSRDTDATTRWGDYSKVYEKVTSGAKGPASNGAVQLAMYWQLHLAYDKDYNFKIYDRYQEQFDSLFFARMDSYARGSVKAPAPKGVALKVDSDKDNNLMRLACAAAQKDVLEFFVRWGMEPDALTKAYAAQFPKETRAIWLASDDKRVRVLEAGKDPGSESYSAVVDGSVSYDENDDNNTVHIELTTSDSSDKFIGYEIFRIEQKGKETIRTAVKFVPADGTGTAVTEDVIATINNRAFTYEVVGYNLWLQPTKPVNIGQARVSHSGNMDQTNWSAVTNMLSDNPPLPGEGEDEEPDAVRDDAILCVIDGDNGTTFTGKTTETFNADGTKTPAADPEVVIYLNGEETLTALEYQLADGKSGAIGKFTIEVSADGTTWTKVPTEKDVFNLSGTTDSGAKVQKVVFSKKNAVSGKYELCTYDASMVKLTAVGQAGKTISISEIVLFGQTGDRIDWVSNGVGYLKEDYVNPKNPAEKLISKGSLIFTGEYAGNPAYNVVLLWDENNKVVGGKNGEEIKAGQLIFAPDPGEGDLTRVEKGKWVYYIDAADLGGVNLPAKVRAELYRVDNALTNEGQRLVSSTVFIDMPKTIPEILLEGTDLSQASVKKAAEKGETP